MKNIYVLMHDDAGQESRLLAALDVTRALDGHLTCIDVAIMPATAFDRALEHERVTEAANRQRIEQRLTGEDIPWTWIEVADYLEEGVIKACDLADLIVVNSENGSIGVDAVRRVAGSLVGESRKPILAVPESRHGFDAAGNVLIAWDGSPPADAAVTTSVPLLRLARSVTVLQIDDDSTYPAPEELAAHLSRHDIHVDVLREKSKPSQVDDLLMEKATSGHFSYVVMGAYSRPRLLETLFGGATQRMLEDSPIPLLLAH